MAKRVRAARHYQRRDSQVRLLAVHAMPGLARDFRGALGHLGNLVPTERALGFARAGDWAALKAHISWGHYREILKAPFSRIGKLRQAGGELGAKKINGSFAQANRRVRFGKISEDSVLSWEGIPSHGDVAPLEKAIGDRFNFDTFDAKTLARLRREQDRLITSMETSARDSIDAIISSAAITGLGPEEIVSDIRELIGLNDRQALAVLNYQNNLYDQGYDQSDIERLVGGYTDRSLDYRAEMIARTESSRAVNSGLQDSYRQAIERGALPSEAIRQFWILGDNPCPICESIPDNNPDGIEIGDTFDSDAGPVESPPLHPNCFCEIEVITDLDKVPDSEE